MTSLEISGNVTPKENATITYYDTDGTTILGTQTVTAKSLEVGLPIPLKAQENMWLKEVKY